MKFAVVACASALFIAAATLCADDPVQSHWRPDDLRIDGEMTDWPGQTFVSKEVATSVVNDAQDIYVLVATSDPAVNLQLTRAGLVVYLDPKSGRGRAFGIRIPPLGNRLAPGSVSAGGEGEPPVLTYFDVMGP